jgi:hypothetical protein
MRSRVRCGRGLLQRSQRFICVTRPLLSKIQFYVPAVWATKSVDA